MLTGTLAELKNAHAGVVAYNSERKVARLRTWKPEEDRAMVERSERHLLASFPATDTEGRRIAREVAQFYADPLGFVKYAFPWGERGMLEGYSGPDRWQEEALRELGAEVQRRNFNGVATVAPIRMAVSSGH